jgi:hypothetical protein
MFDGAGYMHIPHLSWYNAVLALGVLPKTGILGPGWEFAIAHLSTV